MGPTRLAVLVASPDEARLALRAGADFVLAPARRERPSFGVPERLQAAGGAPRLFYAVAADEAQSADPRPVALMDAPADPAPLRAEGFAAALLDPGRALLRAFSPDAVERFVLACRAAGLESWLGGALELPDLPRLLALGPDAVVLESPDEARIAAARRMLAGPPPGETAGPAAAFDTVIVRDLVVHARIGAYRFETDRTQRVRFNMEIAVRRPPRRPLAIADVYSYDVAIDAARRLAEGGHVELVETLAEDLAALLLRDPRVEHVRLRVEKLDLGPEAVGIEIRRSRDDLTV